MTDEALFYKRFVEDVRRCAKGRAPSSVAEIERRVRVALIAPPSVRERRWSRVVAAINDLLSGGGGDPEAAARLRAFALENADLGRPRDVAITDFHLMGRPQGILSGARDRAYLVFAPIACVSLRPVGVLDEVVPAPTRRLAEWAVYGLCGGAALAALWFSFIVPV